MKFKKQLFLFAFCCAFLPSTLFASTSVSCSEGDSCTDVCNAYANSQDTDTRDWSCSPSSWSADCKQSGGQWKCKCNCTKKKIPKPTASFSELSVNPKTRVDLSTSVHDRDLLDNDLKDVRECIGSSTCRILFEEGVEESEQAHEVEASPQAIRESDFVSGR